MTKKAITDPAVQQKATRNAKARDYRDRQDLIYLLDRPEGRRFLWRLVNGDGDLTGGFGWLTDVPMQPHELAMGAIGRQQNSFALARLIRELRPGAFVQMEADYEAPSAGSEE
jgi:hypothetical protein